MILTDSLNRIIDSLIQFQSNMQSSSVYVKQLHTFWENVFTIASNNKTIVIPTLITIGIGLAGLVWKWFVNRWESKIHFNQLLKFIKVWHEKNVEVLKLYSFDFNQNCINFGDNENLDFVPLTPNYSHDIKGILDLNKTELSKLFLYTKKSYTAELRGILNNKEVVEPLNNEIDLFNYLNTWNTCLCELQDYRNKDKDTLFNSFGQERNNFIVSIKEIIETEQKIHSDATSKSPGFSNYFDKYFAININHLADHIDNGPLNEMTRHENYLKLRIEYIENNQWEGGFYNEDLKNKISNAILNLTAFKFLRSQQSGFFKNKHDGFERRIEFLNQTFDRMYKAGNKWFIFYPKK